MNKNQSENKQVKATNKEIKKQELQKKSKKNTIIAILVIVAVLVCSVLFIPKFRSNIYKTGMKASMAGAIGGYNLYSVERRDIQTTLTGTGTLQPYDSYSITATVSGDILSADFEEMDKVLEDEVLYVIDSSDIEDDIADKRRDVADALEDYNEALDDKKDLSVVSDYTGTIRDIYVEKGDKVSEGTKLAYIVDNETMLLELPFFAQDVDFIKIGDKASVNFSSTGEILDATVCEISNLKSLNQNNSTIKNITLSVSNPGGIYLGMKAYANVLAENGNTYYCSGEGEFKYNEEETITASASGEIETLNFDEGDKIQENQIFATIYSDSLEKQIKQLKKAYDSQQNALDDLLEKYEDYTITAPISGTIVQKNYKELDTIGSNSMSSTTSLAIIYDMSKLTFDMPIDELDLAMIEVGQIVKITSDSIENATFEGVVTKKSIVGSSSNGTTVYPVTIELPENDKLLPGMNVNAEIIISNTENVLTIPISAVKRGNKVEIVKNIDQNTKTSVVQNKPETELIDVEIGASNEDYIEIKSGLSEGDIVVAEIVNVSQDMFSAMFGSINSMRDTGMMGGAPTMQGGQPGNRQNMSGGAIRTGR